jgi:SAM-dependent methyltransferase
MTKAPDRFSRQTTEDAEAGCREHFVDTALYDYEYRRRRADIHFYRRLARNRLEFATGSILDLACGSGRLLVPLARDGHCVVGIDRSLEMLRAAARRLSHLSVSRRCRCALVRADLRAYHLHAKASMAIAAFHSLQHLLRDEDILAFLRTTRANLMQGGWLAFDVLPPDPVWLARDPNRRWGRSTFRHPTTRQRLVYTTNHVFDPVSRLLHMRLYYQPVDEKSRPAGPERMVRLCHRQLWPDEVRRMLGETGFRLIEVFAGFDGTLLADNSLAADEHVYVAVAA